MKQQRLDLQLILNMLRGQGQQYGHLLLSAVNNTMPDEGPVGWRDDVRPLIDNAARVAVGMWRVKQLNGDANG